MFQSYLLYGQNTKDLRNKTYEIAKKGNISLNANSPDIFTIAPIKKSITIDQIRYLKSHIAQKPLKEKYRLVIIENAHMATLEAQNALLKTLEEPPSHAIIVLEAKNYKSLIPTILSRVVKIKVSKTKTKMGDQLILGVEIHQALETIAQAQNPQEFLDNQIISLTKSLEGAIRAEGPHGTVYQSKSSIISAIEKCNQTKKMIDANVNPKFALANLIFSLNTTSK